MGVLMAGFDVAVAWSDDEQAASESSTAAPKPIEPSLIELASVSCQAQG